jgi:hypothetical protein
VFYLDLKKEIYLKKNSQLKVTSSKNSRKTQPSIFLPTFSKDSRILASFLFFRWDTAAILSPTADRSTFCDVIGYCWALLIPILPLPSIYNAANVFCFWKYAKKYCFVCRQAMKNALSFWKYANILFCLQPGNEKCFFFLKLCKNIVLSAARQWKMLFLSENMQIYCFVCSKAMKNALSFWKYTKILFCLQQGNEKCSFFMKICKNNVLCAARQWKMLFLSENMQKYCFVWSQAMKNALSLWFSVHGPLVRYRDVFSYRKFSQFVAFEKYLYAVLYSRGVAAARSRIISLAGDGAGAASKSFFL